MVKAEACRLALRRPIGARGLQHVVGAGDVGLDEIARPVDRPVDMGFGGQMHHRVGAVTRENPVQRGAVADIGLLEGIVRAVGDAGHVVQTGRIGQRIEVDHAMPPRDRQPHHRRSDEPGAAGDQQLHGAASIIGERQFRTRPDSGALASLSLSIGVRVAKPPVDADIGIVPAHRAVAVGRIVVGAFVDDLGIGLARDKAVQEPRGHQQLLAVLERSARPRPIARRWASPRGYPPPRRTAARARSAPACPGHVGATGNAARARCRPAPTANGCPARSHGRARLRP